MRAAITTFWESMDNYGSLLQNYALQKFLNMNGIETTLIRAKIHHKITIKQLIRLNLKKGNILLLIKEGFAFFPRRIYLKYIKKLNLLRDFNFFILSHLNPTRVYSSLQDLILNPPLPDIYITGSDQVWNLFCASETVVNDFINLYFLNFGPDNIKRVSCSACICKNEIREGYKEILSNLIKRFEFVSTREQFGVNFCKKIDYPNAQYQPDPSFLLSVKDYQKLYNDDKSFLPKHSYILVYLLNNKCTFNIHKLNKWAKKKNLEIVYISGNESYFKISLFKKFYATIPQWLELLEKAKYVFTNSFHGTVFSIIYNKKFITIEQQGRWEYSNSRVYSLLNEFELINRIWKKDFDKVDENIDFEKINSKLYKIRKESPFVKWTTEEITNNQHI